MGRLRWWSRQTGCRRRTSQTGTVGNVEPGVRWLCGCQPGAGGSVGDPRWRPSCCPTRRRTQSCSAASVSQPSPRRPTNLPKRPAACPAGRRAAPPHDSGATADARARTASLTEAGAGAASAAPLACTSRKSERRHVVRVRVRLLCCECWPARGDAAGVGAVATALAPRSHARALSLRVEQHHPLRPLLCAVRQPVSRPTRQSAPAAQPAPPRAASRLDIRPRERARRPPPWRPRAAKLH